MDNKIQLFSNNTEKLATFVTALFKRKVKKNIIIAFYVMFCVFMSGFFLTCQPGPAVDLGHDLSSSVILSDLCDAISSSAESSVPSIGLLKHSRYVGQYPKRSFISMLVNSGRGGRFSLFAESMLRFPSGLAEMSHHLISLGKLLN